LRCGPGGGVAGEGRPKHMPEAPAGKATIAGRAGSGSVSPDVLHLWSSWLRVACAAVDLRMAFCEL
jgi:hypothetical protein